MDIDSQILEMFREKGMRIEFGAQFSAKGQIAQLLDVVKPLLKERDEALATLADMESQEPVAYGIQNTAITGRKQRFMTLHLDRCGQYPELMEPLYALPVPPHSQQSAETVKQFCERNWIQEQESGGLIAYSSIEKKSIILRRANDRCPSHESEQTKQSVTCRCEDNNGNCLCGFGKCDKGLIY